MAFGDITKNIFNKVVGFMSNFFNSGTSTEEQTRSLVSSEMSNAIEGWMNLYVGQAPWLAKNNRSLGLPAAIASELARLVTLEAKVDIVCPAKNEESNSSQRASFLDEQLKPFRSKMRLYCEYGCAGGGLMLKPYVVGDTIAIDCVQATDFLPLAFDSKGKITACDFVEHKKQGSHFYHRVERHEFKNGINTVTNKAYRSSSINDRGTEVSLAEVPEWAELKSKQDIANTERPLFAYFRIPLGNTIDPTSPLGVSTYSRSVNLIEDADKQYQRFLWEFEGGELAIDASEEAFKKDKSGRPILPEGKERLFRPNTLDDVSKSSELFKTFSPSLRDVSLLNGLNAILQKIEFNSGLAYGTLSDPQNVDKTATEIITSKQRSYSTITDIQMALQTAIEDLAYAMDVYATLYNLAPQGAYEVNCVWDDSIVVDAEAERSRDMNEVRMGLMQKWEYRVKWYGEDEETAKKVIADQEAEKAKTQNPFGLT